MTTPPKKKMAKLRQIMEKRASTQHLPATRSSVTPHDLLKRKPFTDTELTNLRRLLAKGLRYKAIALQFPTRSYQTMLNRIHAELARDQSLSDKRAAAIRYMHEQGNILVQRHATAREELFVKRAKMKNGALTAMGMQDPALQFAVRVDLERGLPFEIVASHYGKSAATIKKFSRYLELTDPDYTALRDKAGRIVSESLRSPAGYLMFDEPPPRTDTALHNPQMDLMMKVKVSPVDRDMIVAQTPDPRCYYTGVPLTFEEGPQRWYQYTYEGKSRNVCVAIAMMLSQATDRQLYNICKAVLAKFPTAAHLDPLMPPVPRPQPATDPADVSGHFTTH